jgi:hypothetical protein
MKHAFHAVLAVLVISVATPLVSLGGERAGDAASSVSLLRDVSALHTGGNPASMAIWSDATPLAAMSDGRVLAASAAFGKGRVVVVGHGGFLDTTEADSEVFAANAIEWLGARAAVSPVRVAGVSDVVANELERRGVKFTRVDGGLKKIDLAQVDVVIGSPQAWTKAGREEELKAWLEGGGGALFAETAWGILQLNKDLTLDTLAANRLLEPVGVRFDAHANSTEGKNKAYPIDAALLPLANADEALRQLANESAFEMDVNLPEKDRAANKERAKARARELEFAAKVVGSAFESVPLESQFVAHAKEMAASHRERLDGVYAKLGMPRLTAKTDPLARALIDLDSRLANELPPRDVKAHASSVMFPGPVGKARDVSATVTIDCAIPGWHTTGLYAAPGELVTIDVPDALIGATIQVGAWRDPHEHAYRVRLRHGLRRFTITSPTTAVASAIGGPIYIDVPEDAAWRSKGSHAVQIHNALRAPRFKLGVTDLDAWKSEIRNLEAPWAEMETANLIFTVPSDAIRTLDRPDLAMQHWDKVHEAMQSLEPRTPNHWADRPYRYVADVSVSWGYMYCPSDGPIVIPASAAADMFILDNFDAVGENKLWGHYHEMGHSHQNPLWTDGSTGEVTVNIFTVYALHMVNGYAINDEATRCTPKYAMEIFHRQRDEKRRWKDAGGPFESLQFYALLWQAFGFDAFHTTFDAIRSLPSEQRPKGDDEERNLFLLTFATSVKKNLAPYGEAWGINVSEATREAMKAWEVWMPEEETK